MRMMGMIDELNIWMSSFRQIQSQGCFINIIKVGMRPAQQKQSDSQGEFQAFAPEVQTINRRAVVPPALHRRNYNPRSKMNSEKQKLGLVIEPSLTEPEYSSVTAKASNHQNGKIIKIGSATFRSNYQSGNIGTVDLIGINNFKITLDQQANSARSNSWFYFTVEGVKGEAHFLIKGFSKKSSLYNEGMKICYRDLKESDKWRRGGLYISYQSYSEGEEEESSYCLKFTYFFRNNQSSSIDFAYSFPYTFQKLNFFLASLQPKIKVTRLGASFEDRSIPLITLGNHKSKDLIIISARVHPGQTGSSFIAEGFIKQLIGQSQYSKYLRDRFFFKIVPMINVDGVCRGNYRFSAAGVDLNRKWKEPSSQYHPQIFLLKEMIRKQSKERKLRMFIDLHGHSRKKNVFFYGCCRSSQQEDDFAKAKAFPYLMSRIHPVFSYEDCSFNIQKNKEGTARIALFKEFRINQIFTLETSFCGTSKGSNFNEIDYERIGRKLCEGISTYFYQPEAISTDFSAKIVAFKQSSLDQLSSNPTLLKVGNQDSSGSDSEPEKGQIPQKNIKPPSEKKQLQTKRASNIGSASNHHRMTPKIPSSLKQKSEAAIPEDKQQKQRELYMYLLQAPSQLFEADFKSKQAHFKNQRVHSVVRSSNCYRHPKNKMAGFQQEDLFFNTLSSQKPSEKTKIYLMMGREGAQYRRVRKMAEENMKQQSVEKLPIEIKGIKGHKIEMDNCKTIQKAGLPSQKSKYRRTSAQMFFRKPLRMQDRLELNRNQLSVLCRGRQIIF